jgi:3-dehydrosphinganine reductase
MNDSGDRRENNGQNQQVVLVTGGSSGIGKAIAVLFAQQGAKVWILARRQELLDQAILDLEKNRVNQGQFFRSISCDVAYYDKVSEAMRVIIEASGAPDILVNSAGITYPGYVQELDLEVFHDMMAVNYFGTVYTVKTLLPAMISRGSGHIVNISSLAAIIGVFGYSAYSPSKYAVRGFSDILRAEMKSKGIRVSVAFPTDTDTPQLEFENQFKPAETKAISGEVKPASAEKVAREILSGVAHNRYIILPGLEAKIIYRLLGFTGNLVYPVVDWLASRAKTDDANPIQP